MLRGFLLISLLLTIAIIAVFGFRGQKSTGSPLEIFPDMVRQMKVRAQAPLNFFSDGRGPRLPVTGTLPIGYEMPKPQTIATPAATAATVEALQTHPALVSARIITTPAKWATIGEQVFRWKSRAS